MKDNSNKIILDLCGGSGAWSKPYADAGYTVHNITLPDYSVRGNYVSKSANNVIFVSQTDKPDILCRISDIYGILAAPPCTEFSKAKSGHTRDFESGMKAVKACLEIVWHCRTHGNLKFWALENPTAFLRQFLGKPPWSFYHWEFGGYRAKPTDIWGYFNTPKPTVLMQPEHTKIGHQKSCFNYGKIKLSADHNSYIQSLPSSKRSAAISAITPAGFSQAFYKANR
jgi:hypothetical protein